MINFWKRLGVLVLVGWATLGNGALPADAQVRLNGAVQDAARTAAASAQGLASGDAYRQGFNPFRVSNTSGGFYAPLGGASGFAAGSVLGDSESNNNSWNSAALAMNSLGQLGIANQQALLVQEAVRREQLRNRRRRFDEWLYERANTPTLEQLRQEELAREWDHSRNNPPVTEIYSGKALNSLLNGWIKVQGQGNEGQSVHLGEDVLQHINVTSAEDGGNFGLLRDGGKLEWPLALTELPSKDASATRRQQIATHMGLAVDQASHGRVSPHLLKKLRDDVAALRDALKQDARNLSFADYREALKYLHNLTEAVQVLSRPDAAKYLNGAYTLDKSKIATVQDLVRFMSTHGLTFAPAIHGDEAAYLALQRTLANPSKTQPAVVAARAGDQ